MEVQVKELIEKIKSDGIEEAGKKAKEIEEEAHKKAQHILSEADKEASALKEQAKAEAEKFEVTGKQAVIQAGRDIILSLRSEITALFDSMVLEKLKEALSPGLLKSIISKMLESWAAKDTPDITILLSPSDLKSLEHFFFKEFSQELLKGVEIKAGRGLEKGFRIAEKDGSAFYDISDRGIAEALCQYLNPKIAECMDEAFKSGSRT
jgi:V/A-type H+-transporting ATPase subunit E